MGENDFMIHNKLSLPVSCLKQLSVLCSLSCIRDQSGNLVKELVPFCMKCARQKRKLEGTVM